MMIRILRFLRGYVRFCISGRLPERFINIALKNGVSLWGTERVGDSLYSCMYLSDYRSIRRLARRASCRLKVAERHGLPVLLRSHRDRVGVAVGAVAFVAVIFVMSLFVWSIDITGLERVSESELRDSLRRNGVYIGAFKPSLDFTEVARNVMLNIGDISWMAVNAQGSFASVEVKEEAPAPDVSDTSVPANIKAGADGTIVRMNIKRGDSYITEGSGVVRGQLLVSGVVPDALGGVTLVRSDAEIIARTVRTASFSVPRRLRLTAPTGEHTQRYRASFLFFELPLSMGSIDGEYSVTRTYRESPVFLDTVMPMSRITESVHALSDERITLNDRSAKELLLARSDMYECFSLSSCTVESRDASLSSTDESYVLDVTYTCLEDIAVRDFIGTDENTDRLIVRSAGDNE